MKVIQNDFDVAMWSRDNHMNKLNYGYSQSSCETDEVRQ